MMTIEAEQDRHLQGLSPQVHSNLAFVPASRHPRQTRDRLQTDLRASNGGLILTWPGGLGLGQPSTPTVRQKAALRYPGGVPEFADAQAAKACRLPLPERAALRFGERIALGLLTVGAVFSVGYGLLGGIGFTANWDLFKTGIQSLLQ